MPPRLLPSAAAPTVLRIGRRTPASNPGWKNRRPRRPAPAASPAPDLVPALAAGLALALPDRPLPAAGTRSDRGSDLLGRSGGRAGLHRRHAVRLRVSPGRHAVGPAVRLGMGLRRPAAALRRGRCRSARDDQPPFTGPWPNSVVIDRSTESTVITNDATAVQSNQQQTGDGTIQSGTAGGDQILRNSPVTGD